MSPVAWIGIDPSYSAYAIVRIHDDGSYYDQVLDFSPKKVGSGPQRLEAIFQILSEKFWAANLAYSIKAIALEGYAMQARFGREIAGELGGVTKVALMRELKRAPIIVPPPSLKKFVSGNGKADKNDIKGAVYEKWGAQFKSHDRADAFGLAQVAKASTRGTAVEYEKEVMSNLSTLKKRNPRV
jgi:Holliday junction resolvasome RuvABC endonuclease subunit